MGVAMVRAEEGTPLPVVLATVGAMGVRLKIGTPLPVVLATVGAVGVRLKIEEGTPLPVAVGAVDYVSVSFSFSRKICNTPDSTVLRPPIIDDGRICNNII